MVLQPTDGGVLVREWAALVISIVALLQVPGIALWKRYVRRGRIKVHETGTIEVSFGVRGPSIGLLGTLRSVYQEVFVEEMQVRVVRCRDRAARTLRWSTFRSAGGNPAGPGTAQFELARSFLVQPTAPQNYNIFFKDDEFVAEFQARINKLRVRWHDFASAKLRAAGESDEQLTRVLTDQEASRTVFSEFVNDEVVREMVRGMDERFFWYAGEYELHLHVQVASPAMPAVKSWSFTIDSADAQELKNNIYKAIRGAAGFKDIHHTLYTTYLPPSR